MVQSNKLQHYNNLLPPFNEHGYLPPGKHRPSSWQEFVERFGTTEKRHQLLAGMKKALLNLQQAGCQKAYIDGSFVTEKLEPSDYDGYWDVHGVDWNKLDEILRDFTLEGCEQQKIKYRGELLIKGARATTGQLIQDYYTRNTPGGIEKGIVVIDLQSIVLEP